MDFHIGKFKFSRIYDVPRDISMFCIVQVCLKLFGYKWYGSAVFNIKEIGFLMIEFA